MRYPTAFLNYGWAGIHADGALDAENSAHFRRHKEHMGRIEEQRQRLESATNKSLLVSGPLWFS